ncbi:hypothetical protein DQ04_07621050 [Trypanosoma grayi]|uniref:hypothetical protein n=1 Tax=Trypanosoma grayi TaxID=71804 RepID=UPI0004F4A685|nr:hypothetical protein DQ04_07621050 [Trypanosoma grayi]KEG08255.1 hypothetical protein DQ04_07621050 [Trypanosoma grayi]
MQPPPGYGPQQQYPPQGYSNHSAPPPPPAAWGLPMEPPRPVPVPVAYGPGAAPGMSDPAAPPPLYSPDGNSAFQYGNASYEPRKGKESSAADCPPATDGEEKGAKNWQP